MKKSVSIIAALLLATQIFLGCHSFKPSNVISKATQQTEKNINVFEQTVVYKFNQVKLLKTQEEKEVSAEIIVNPTEKTITINDESSEKEKGSVTYPIESIDCNYNNGLRDGYAFYRTWSQGLMKRQKRAYLKLK